MPSVTWSETVSWARAACGVPVGRYIDSPGSSRIVLDAVGRVHLPLLGPAVWNTNTSWLSVWTANPWEPGGVR